MIGRLVWGLLGLFMPSDKLWRLLDVTGIVIFVGPNGSGKSLCAVASALDALDGIAWDCLDYDHQHHGAFREHADGCGTCAPHMWRFRRAKGLDGLRGYFCDDGLELLDAGSRGERLIYSTVALLDEDGRDHPRYRSLLDYAQLLTIEHADVIFDEVAGVSDASDSGSIPVQVVNWLHQLRKRDVRLRVTTPAYARCSKPIRQVAQVVVDCRSFFAERRSAGRLWRPRRGFLMVAYDAFQFEDFTSSTARAVADDRAKARRMRLARGLLWRPGHRAEWTYNTLAQVTPLGHVTEAGMCSRCGGQRSRPRCACTHDELSDVGPVSVVESVSASGSRVRKVVPLEETSKPATAERTLKAVTTVGGSPQSAASSRDRP